MKLASVGEMEAHFGDFVTASETAPVVVTKDGCPIAVLVGIEDEDDLERLLMGCSAQLRAILDRSRRQSQEGRGILHEDFWKRAESRNSTKRPASGKAKKSKKG